MTRRDRAVGPPGQGPLARFAGRLPSYGPLILIVVFNIAVFGWLLQALKPRASSSA